MKTTTTTSAFDKAFASYKTVGASRASGDALCAMYAKLITDVHAGASEIYYDHLRIGKDDAEVTTRAKRLLNDRTLAWDVLMGL